MESIFSTTSVLSIEISYISFVYKNDKLLNIFELISEELTTSKRFYLKLIEYLLFLQKNEFFSGSNRSPASQAMYEKTNKFVEKLADRIYVGLMRYGVPFFVLPKAIISYITYFTTDAGRDSFELPFIA